MLIEILKRKATALNLLTPDDEIDLAAAFQLVRDMPYSRASSREPQTIIDEWRGTCSGKHYLLKALFAELGYSSRLIACTTVSILDPQDFEGEMHDLLEKTNGRFVDVHNYLILELPGGEMIVDATWPLSALGSAAVVNEQFILGQDQKIAVEPIESWEIPPDRDPQESKDQILAANFTPEEIAYREKFIHFISQMSLRVSQES